MNAPQPRAVKQVGRAFPLAYCQSAYWLLFTAFVGLNLLQSAFTNWCPMMAILQKLGVKSQCQPHEPATGFGK
jgi:hypothetical protein